MRTGRNQRLLREEKAFPVEVPHVVVLLHTMAKKQGAQPGGLCFEKMVGKS